MKCIRKMGTQEKMDWIFNRVSPVNFVTCAQVSGRISAEDLCHALDCLKRRHPLLDAGIQRSGWWGGRFVHTDSSGVPVEIIEQGDRRDLTSVIEAECMERFPEQGPFARCVLFRHSQSRSTLMLTLDHAIADGMSGVLAVRDLMLVLGSSSSLDPLPPAKPVEGYFPENMLGIRGWLKHIVFLARTLQNDFAAANMVPCTPDGYAPYDDCRMHLITKEISPEVTRRLRRHARANGITVNAMLLSAQIVASAIYLGITEPSTFTAGYDVDMRKRLPVAVEDHVGMFLSAAVTSHKAHCRSDLTDLAKDINRAKDSLFDRGDLFTGYPKFLQILNSLLFVFGTGNLGAKIYTGIYKSFPVNVMISNLGDIDIETVYGDHEVEKIGFVVSSSVWGLINLLVSTLNDTMVLNFTCLDPLITKEHLCAVAHSTVEILEKTVS